MTNRENAIQTIRRLFPANSEYYVTNLKGKELLNQAICECWESLPDEILIRYAALCEQADYNLIFENSWEKKP